jgi:hypothetical protein
VSEGPFTIASGGTKTVVFAIVGGNSLAELESNADNALNAWNNPGTPIEPNQTSLPDRYELFQNFPNPFNPTTTISYQLARSGEINLKIYNITGQEVQTLESGYKQAGNYKLSWDGKDSQGNRIASGVYFYQLTVSGEENLILTRKMMFLK